MLLVGWHSDDPGLNSGQVSAEFATSNFAVQDQAIQKLVICTFSGVTNRARTINRLIDNQSILKFF